MSCIWRIFLIEHEYDSGANAKKVFNYLLDQPYGWGVMKLVSGELKEYGGNRVWIGESNHLNENKFVEFVFGLDWSEPRRLVLTIWNSDGDGPTRIYSPDSSTEYFKTVAANGEEQSE